jgi:hypothetical protein
MKTFIQKIIKKGPGLIKLGCLKRLAYKLIELTHSENICSNVQIDNIISESATVNYCGICVTLSPGESHLCEGYEVGYGMNQYVIPVVSAQLR